MWTNSEDQQFQEQIEEAVVAVRGDNRDESSELQDQSDMGIHFEPAGLPCDLFREQHVERVNKGESKEIIWLILCNLCMGNQAFKQKKEV